MQFNIKSKNDRRSRTLAAIVLIRLHIEAVKRSTPCFEENLELLNHEINARTSFLESPIDRPALTPSESQPAASKQIRRFGFHRAASLDFFEKVSQFSVKDFRSRATEIIRESASHFPAIAHFPCVGFFSLARSGAEGKCA